MSKGMGFGNIVKQAQELQERLAKVQEEAASRTVEASAGGGMVKATVNGRLEVVRLHIEAAVLQGGDTHAHRPAEEARRQFLYLRDVLPARQVVGAKPAWRLEPQRLTVQFRQRALRQVLGQRRPLAARVGKERLPALCLGRRRYASRWSGCRLGGRLRCGRRRHGRWRGGRHRATRSTPRRRRRGWPPCPRRHPRSLLETGQALQQVVDRQQRRQRGQPEEGHLQDEFRIRRSPDLFVGLQENAEGAIAVFGRDARRLLANRRRLFVGQLGQQRSPAHLGDRQVAEMFEQVAREAAQVAAAPVGLVERLQHARRVARDDGIGQLGDDPAIGDAERVEHVLVADRARGAGDHLVEQRLRVAHAALPFAC